MGSRSHTHQKPGSDSTASAASVWRTRGFAPQPQPIVERTLPDLQAQIDHAQRYGHSLSKCSVSPATTPLPIQAKLTVGEVGDPYEQEADRVAQQVVQRLHEPNMVSPQLARSVQREAMPGEEGLQMSPLADPIQRAEMPDEDELQMKPERLQRVEMPDEDELQMKPERLQRAEMPDEDELQMKPSLQRVGMAGGAVSDDFDAAIQSARGGGQPLDPGLQVQMGQAMGADFSKVRVHTDAQSDQLNQSIQARAFTTGQDVFFRQEAYEPGNRGGQELIAHELTHVVQQTGGIVRQPSRDVHRNAMLFRQEIQSFQRAHSPEQRSALQRQLAPNIQHDPSRTLRRKGGAAAFAPAIGRNKTKLTGTCGEFNVEHGLDKAPTDAASGEYYIKIEMTPNAATDGKDINFLQTVRRGTSTGNYSTKATDSGMTKERAERTTAAGWRVDRADPATDKTPLYGMKKNNSGNVVSRGNANTGKFGGNKPWMEDTPNVLDPSVMEFVATAIDPAAGTDFGAVSWGFEYDSSASLYKEKTPALVSAGDPSLVERAEAIKKWNAAVAKPGSGIDQAPEVRPPAPPVGDFPVPSGETRYA